MIRKKELLERIEYLEDIQTTRFKECERMRYILNDINKINTNFNDGLMLVIKTLNDKINKQENIIKKLFNVIEPLLIKECEDSLDIALLTMEDLVEKLITESKKKEVEKPKKKTKTTKPKKETK